MHECDGGLAGGIVEILEEAAHLRGDEHALVHDRASAHRADVEGLALQARGFLRALFDGAPTYI